MYLNSNKISVASVSLIPSGKRDSCAAVHLGSFRLNNNISTLGESLITLSIRQRLY
ncbi:hypothetical protein THIOM_000367 [Candidatus Thiomargarita nelsonii]|uniref:Uncharacterized protein n=1 Tax=Candidatus Thiomargarita nelsonii TaxID=1003181 RepID=A0A176S7A9_9GAMM|nr:hypothetical protein THIOM_000367 [Candidatus Thiomargarita nelsonii]